MPTQKAVQIRCPECGSDKVVKDLDMGEFVCSNCGLVIGEDIADQGAEWRAFTPEERKAKVRAGTPVKYSHFDKGLSTVIRVGKDAFGRPLSPKVKREMWRLRRWQMRSKIHASKSRNLMKAMNELQRLSDVLSTPSSVQEMAAVVYRKALNEGLVRGRSIKGMIAAALYAAYRFTKNPRTLKEITEASFQDIKEVSRNYRLIVRRLDMKMPIDRPLDYVTKIAEKARVSSDVEGLALRLIIEAKKKYATAGKDPSGLAAAALYIAAKLLKEKVTQSQLAKAANVTEVTIRNRKRELVKTLQLDL
jgi:transcription initiation factor TFIIB